MLVAVDGSTVRCQASPTQGRNIGSETAMLLLNFFSQLTKEPPSRPTIQKSGMRKSFCRLNDDNVQVKKMHPRRASKKINSTFSASEF